MHNRYFISGFGAGNRMIDPYLHILAMYSNFISNRNHIYYLNIQCFIMKMPLNMILIMYGISCRWHHAQVG